MPCDQIRRYSINMASVKLAILKETLKDLGFRVKDYSNNHSTYIRAFDSLGNRLEIENEVIAGVRVGVKINSNNNSILEKIKQQYPVNALTYLAKEKGWEVREPDKLNQFTGQTTKTRLQF